MIENRKILAIILAPGTEKGLAKRSFREIAGKTLLEIAIQCAADSRYVDQVVVATDDEETLAFCKRLKVQASAELFYDHPELMVRADKCGMKAVEAYHASDYVLLLDPGYPLRISSDIDRVIELSHRSAGVPVVAVSDTEISLTDLYYLTGDRGLLSVFPRFDQVNSGQASVGSSDRKLYQISYSTMVASRGYLKSTGTYLGEKSQAYLIPKERAFHVESKADLSVANALVRGTTSGYFQSRNQPNNKV